MSVFHYAVRPGDTLAAIADHCGASVDDLLALNPHIADRDLIRVGQMLRLPEAFDHRAAAEALAPSGPEPLWLKIARRELGVDEAPGPANDPRVLEYLSVCERLPEAYRGRDSTPWCAAFLCWTLHQAGLPHTASAWALGYKDWGADRTETAPLGAIAVFTREPAGKAPGGHVGYYLGEDGGGVRVLGGNQSDAVTIQTYPRKGRLGSTAYELLSLRWPKGA